MKSGKRRRDDIILIKDLAPRKDILGGAGKRVFGERAETQPAPEEGTRRGKKK